MFVEPGLRHDGYETGLSGKRSDAEPGGLQQNKISGKGIVMKRQIEEQKGRILWIIINISVFCLILLLTYITPFYADDLMNKKIFGTETDIQNVGDVAESVKSYYISWGGRASAQFLIQIFQLFDKRLFDIVNAFVYVAVAYVIYKYIEPDRKRNNVLLLFIHFMLWFFMPTFGGEAVWLTGSITYLWELLIVLSFGLVYYRVCVTEEKGGGFRRQAACTAGSPGNGDCRFFCRSVHRSHILHPDSGALFLCSVERSSKAAVPRLGNNGNAGSAGRFLCPDACAGEFFTIFLCCRK